MAAVKTPCFDYQAATLGKEKDYGLTAEEIRPIWEYAKKRYLNNGVSIEDTIHNLSRETGAPARFFQEVIVGPKSMPRLRTKEMFEQEDARRNAKWQAQQMIDRADTSNLMKAIHAASQLPKASLTAAHGGVFPVTHAGGLLLNPSAWHAFFSGAMVSWRSVSKSYYEAARIALLDDPYYARARNAGLRIALEDRPKGILSDWMTSSQNWSSRAWLGVQKIRLEYFKQMVESTPKALRGKTVMDQFGIDKGYAEIANHATGVSNIQFLGQYISKAPFAPQLLTSKLMRVTHDPFVTMRTAAKMLSGKSVSAGERAAMYMRVRGASEFLGMWAGGLMLNQALLSYFGSSQKINYYDVTQSDFGRFKLGEGTVLASRGVEEYLRLFGQLIAVGTMNKRALHGKTPIDAALDRISRFGLYKSAPGPTTAGELFYGHDIFGRPLPPTVQAARSMVGLQKQYAKPGKPQYSEIEYALSKAPIFLIGPAADIYDDMRSKGLSAPTATSIAHAALLAALEFTGQGGYREREQRPTPTRGKTKYHGYSQ